MELAIVGMAAVAILVAPLLGRTRTLGVLIALRSLSDIGAATVGSLLPSSTLSSVIGLSIIIVGFWPGGRKLGRRVTIGLTMFLLLILLGTFVAGVWFGIVFANIAESVRWISLAAVFIHAYRFIDLDASKFARSITLIVLPSIILSCVGLIFQSPVFVHSSGRLAGTFSHPNTAGAFFASAMIILTVIAFTTKLKVFWLPSAAAAVVCIGTASLGSMVAAAASVAIAITVSRQQKIFIKIVSVLIMLASTAAILSLPAVASRLLEFEGSRTDSDSSSLGWRFLNWELLISKWLESPFFGFGIGSSSIQIIPLGGPPHSAPVQILVEFGFVGLIVSTILLFTLFSSGVKRNNLGKWSGTLWIAVGLFIIINGSESNLLGYTATGYLLAYALGSTAIKKSIIIEQANNRVGKING